MSASLIIGDVRSVLAKMPDASVDLVLTSPPFLALRSYLPADHPDKALEIGSEPTPADFLDTLLAVTADLRRVLAPHGSLCVELGDTYAGSGGAGGDYGEGGLRERQERFDGSASRAYGTSAAPRPARVGRDRNRKNPMPDGKHEAGGGVGWPEPKSLCCIPDLYQVALAYGINPLTGAESPAGRWRVRNKRPWCRPNPPVGALGDKVRPATSYVVMACTARDRWFDLDAVRVPSDYDRPNLRGNGTRGPGHDVPGQKHNSSDHTVNVAGAPPLDWVKIPTQPYPGSHYATWPEELCVEPILMMCPEKVCRTCGEPSRRIVETSRPIEQSDERVKHANGERPAPGRQDRAPETGWQVDRSTLGWTDCGHGDWRRGVVLDPFAGSGTSGQVATRLGRDAILIDLDERNEQLIRERIGLFMDEVVHVRDEAMS